MRLICVKWGILLAIIGLAVAVGELPVLDAKNQLLQWVALAGVPLILVGGLFWLAGFHHQPHAVSKQQRQLELVCATLTCAIGVLGVLCVPVTIATRWEIVLLVVPSYVFYAVLWLMPFEYLRKENK